VEIVDTKTRDLTIGLCLLWNKLVSRLDVVDAGDQFVLQLSTGSIPGDCRATVTWEKNSALLVLSETELKALMFFCLRSARDGLAEVDHVDIEAEPAVAGGRSGSFVLKFPTAKPPVSANQARRRLGCL
jgi:hypothetical protein